MKLRRHITKYFETLAIFLLCMAINYIIQGIGHG